MNRHIVFPLTVVLGAVLSTTAAGAKADAANEREALVMVSAQIDIIEGVRKYCGRELGQWKSKIDYIALKWADQNIEAVRAVESFKEHDASSKQQAIAREVAVSQYLSDFKVRASSGRAEGVCGGFFHDITAGHQDVSSETPKAGGFLRDYLKNHPLSPAAADKLNFTMGCLKSSLNNRNDHDLMISACNCLYEVESTKVSKKERETADQMARSGGDVSSLPHMKRIQPLLSACVVDGSL